MFMQELYVNARLHQEYRPEPRNTADPQSEVPRSGVGLVHEVFRRITLDAEPARVPLLQRLTNALGG